MKIQLALIFLFFYTFSFSQNKKKQIEYLNFKLDSLNYVIEQERTSFSNQVDVASQNLKKANKRSTKKITELTEELRETKSQLEFLKKDQKLKQQEISNQKNKIQKLNDSISKLKTILDDSKMSEIDFPDFLLDKLWAVDCNSDSPQKRVMFYEQQEGDVGAIIVSFYEGGGQVLRLESNTNRSNFIVYYLPGDHEGLELEELYLFEFKFIDGRLISGVGEFKEELIMCN